MKISYIIPYYNSSGKINHAVNSIINQSSIIDYEIIIVNDFSSEIETKFLEQYSTNKKIVVINLPENGGPGIARNNGLMVASGSVVVFIDSDDYLSDNFVEVLYPILDSEKYDLISFNYNLVSEGSNPKKKVMDYYFCEMVNGEIKDKNKATVFSKGVPWGKAISRNLIKKYDIEFMNFRTGEDMPFTKSAFFLAENVYHIDLPLYNYVMHGESIMHSNIKNSDFEINEGLDYIQNVINRKYSNPLIFKNELEAIYIKEIIYGISLNQFSLDLNKKMISRTRREWNDKYPEWTENTYLQYFPGYVKIILKMVQKNTFLIPKMTVKFKNKLQQFLGTR